MPEHAVGLLFPAGWASSLVDTVDDKNAPLSHMHMQAAGRHLVCPLSKWHGRTGSASASVRVPGRRLVGLAGPGRPRGIVSIISIVV